MKKHLLILAVMLLAACAYAAEVQTGQSVVSLNAVTATGVGSSLQIKQGRTPVSLSRFTWTVKVTGTPDACTVNLEGSLDGTNWFTLDASTTTTSEMRHVVNKSVLYVRANLATLTNGSSPTVTAVILPAGN